MYHILAECAHPTTHRIWTLAKGTWPHDENTWPEINFGTIIGCGALTIRTEARWTTHQTRLPPESPPPKAGATRLIRIIILDATHLIWTLRCERTIHETEHMERTVDAVWQKTMNRRSSNYKIAAMKVLRRDDYTKLIKNTWEKALRKQHGSIPDDWLLRGKGF